jgi:polar amino acid transport system permease protein
VWQELVDAAPFFLGGIGVTLMYTALGAIAALILSFVFGLMALSPSRFVRGVSRTIVEFFRGTSLVVQLLWIYFALPLLGVQFATLAAATIGLGLNFGAYGSEIVRGAINAVPPAQWEATIALSLTRWQRMRKIILPQAIPEMVPPFANLLVQLMKGSSLLFLLGISELTFEVQQLRFEIGSFPAFAIALVVYFMIAQALIALMRLWERRAAARVGRTPAKMRMPQAVTTQ